MLFNSDAFVFAYLPVVLAVYFLVGRRSQRGAIGWLAAASLFFYGWWQPVFLILLTGSILFNFAAASVMRGLEGGSRRIVLVGALAGNLALLGYFKYANFLLDIAGGLGFAAPLQDIVLPLGISFFTFTQIAFLVDTYRGIATEYSLLNYVLFVTYFPHLIAGPVLHHKEMMPQFADPATRRFQPAALAAGLACFAVGLIKKVALADQIAPTADIVFGAAGTGVGLSAAEAWIGAVAYGLQIYFDFSGYSDMAIGLSLMFGVVLPLNFNSPYRATSIIEFWRRWHMTLSRFLRDYLYIPLGGNRAGSVRRYTNLVVTMILGGLWHGAAWTFVVWGALHGAFLLVNHVWRALIGQSRLFAGRVWRAVAGVLTFAAVMAAWVPFRAPDMAATKAMWSAMTGLNGVPLTTTHASWLGKDAALFRLDSLLVNTLFADWRHDLRIMLILLLVALLAPNSQTLLARGLGRPPAESGPAAWLAWRPNIVWGGLAGAGLAVGVLLLGGDSPFLYFQF